MVVSFRIYVNSCLLFLSSLFTHSCAEQSGKISIGDYADQLQYDSVQTKLVDISYSSNVSRDACHIMFSDSTYVSFTHSSARKIIIGNITSPKNMVIDTSKIITQIEIYEALLHKHHIYTVDSKKAYQAISFDLSQIHGYKISSSDSTGVLVFCRSSLDSVMMIQQVRYYNPVVISSGVLYYTYK